MVAFLEDMGITTSWKFIHLTAEEKQRVFKVIRLSKPKNPAFMTILRPDNIHRSRVVRLLINFTSNLGNVLPKYV